MRRRGLVTVLLIGASALAFNPTTAAGQPAPPPGGDLQRQLSQTLRRAMLFPEGLSMSAKEFAGLAERTPAEILTWDRVYTMALVRARSGATAEAESLQPKALDELSRRHDVADFARFRKEFVTGRAGAGGAFHDPGRAYLAVLHRLQVIEDAREHLAMLEHLSNLIEELAQGDFSGLSQLNKDLMAEALLGARRAESMEITTFRDDLDGLKVALGLSAHAAVIPDRRALGAFRGVFRAVEVWGARPDRRLDELARIIGRLPAAGDVIVDGRALLDPVEKDPSHLEDALAGAVRTAIQNRAGAEGAVAPEDRGAALELRVRRRVRHLVETRRGYEDAKRNFMLAVRLRDHSFENLLAPSTVAARSSRAAALTDLIGDQGRIRNARDRLVERWTTFRSERLALYRDLGALPRDNWEAFYADLSAPENQPQQAPAGPAPPSPAAPGSS